MVQEVQPKPSDLGGDTDLETLPPSDSELGGQDLPSSPREISSLLVKMEELNKLNEADARSATNGESNAQGSSSNSGDAGETRESARNGNSRHSGSCPPPPTCEDDDNADENIDLWTVWGNLIKSWECEMKRRPNCVKELVRRGIPQHFRTIAWQLLSNAKSQQTHELYTEYLRQSSPYEKVILRDIPRTYPELEFFKDGGRGQQSLFNVIKTYSIHDREVGYCQGSAFIVGQLLLQMPEEEAFSVFVRLMEHYRLRELYKPTMTQLGLCMFQLEVIVQEQMPDLHMHFNNMGFDTSMYASCWFLTLFTTTLPLDLANRIMDLFLVDGMDAIFRVAIAILQQARIDLLKLDMEGMLRYFQRDIRELYENDHDLLFTLASRVVLNQKKMKKLEKCYLEKRTKEQEEAIELRRLRTENRLLRQRIEYLEHESSALADRLIRGQVDLAQQAENSLNISHELNVLRDINSDAHRRLEEAYETIRELSSADGESKTKCGEGRKEMIETGAQELIEAHSRKSDLENTVREMKLRIHELESANKRLKESSPDGGVAAIQEELIRVKMREAESSLSLKEMRQRLSEMEQQWTKYMQHRAQYMTQRSLSSNGIAAESPIPPLSLNETEPADSPQSSPSSSSERNEAASGNPSSPPNSAHTANGSAQASHTSSAPQRARDRIAKFTATLMGGISSSTTGSQPGDDGTEGALMTQRELEDQFMGLKIREADTLAELKEMRQKVMELETQNHVCTNQLRRQDEELKRIKEEKETILQAEKEVSDLLKGSQRKLMESESEMKEKNVMQRLKYTEALQQIADLRQQVAQYESKNAEKLAQAQLRGSSICDLDDDSLVSNRSAGSFADTNSLASEEMSAFLADVTERNNNGNDSDQSGTDDLTDEEANAISRKKRSANRRKTSKKASATPVGLLNGTQDETRHKTGQAGSPTDP
ncbi:rab-GTPase-TBC domain-containing protein [Ditylenchus destructor]|nr:rab-GTPase-TBC domain-containing protein [Ditylenchus destructor]